MSGPARVVVAGAGLAGLRTIEELRGRGYDGARHAGRRGVTAALRPPAAVQEADDRRAGRHLAARRPGRRWASTSGWASAPTGLADDRLTTDQGDHFASMPWCWPPAPARSRCRATGRQHVLRTLDDALELRPLLAARRRAGHRRRGLDRRRAGHRRGRSWAARSPCVEAGAAPLAAAVGAEIGATTIRLVRRRRGGPAAGPGRGRGAARRPGPGRRRLAARRRGGRPPSASARRWPGWPAPASARQRRGRGRPAAHLDARRVRGRRLRGVLVGPLRPRGCGSSTGTSRCTRPGWPRPTSSAAARPTTRCRTSGPSSSGGWCSTSGYHGGAERLVWRGDPADRKLGRGLAGRRSAGRAADRGPAARPAPGPPGDRARARRWTPCGWLTRPSRCAIPSRHKQARRGAIDYDRCFTGR